MKTRTLSYLLAAVMLTSCYKDKGNYSYTSLYNFSLDTTTLSTRYDIVLGDTLKLNPVINTTVTESELAYHWEVFNAADTFKTISTDRQLRYKAGPSADIPSPGDYKMRLRVENKADHRQLYSDVIQLRVSGTVGLLVLHGNNTESDIDLLVAPQFLVNAGNVPVSHHHHYYSETNGSKIAGKGVQIIHSVSQVLSSNADRCYIVAITDKDMVLAHYTALEKKGDYRSLFMGPTYKGQPQAFQLFNNYVELYLDGGQLFLENSTTGNKFVTGVTPANANIAPYIIQAITNNSNKIVAFDQTAKKFYGITNVYEGGSASSFPLSSPTAIFNTGNMNADLVYMDHGSRNNRVLAVFRNGATRFLAELDFETTTLNDQPVAKYDMNALPEISNALFHAFGDNQINMCYYATSSSVYQYAVNNGNALSATPLAMQNGAPLTFSGEITMMKILKPLRLFKDWATGISPFSYYNYNKVMLIATYEGNVGTLHSLQIDELTGKVISHQQYTGFDRIADANIKGI